MLCEEVVKGDLGLNHMPLRSVRKPVGRDHRKMNRLTRAARSHQTDDPALGKHPRLNPPSCRIQERFRHNHPTFVILPQPIVPDLLEDKIAVKGLVGDG